MTPLEEMARETRAGRISVETFIDGALVVEQAQASMQKCLESYRKLLRGIMKVFNEFVEETGEL